MSDIAAQARYEQFVELHRGPDTFIMPNAWDGPSALLFKEAGFKSIATSSAAFAATLGRIDGVHAGGMQRRGILRELGADVSDISDLTGAGIGLEGVRRILAAIADGDGDRAAALMEEQVIRRNGGTASVASDEVTPAALTPRAVLNRSTACLTNSARRSGSSNIRRISGKPASGAGSSTPLRTRTASGCCVSTTIPSLTGK